MRPGRCVGMRLCCAFWGWAEKDARALLEMPPPAEEMDLALGEKYGDTSARCPGSHDAGVSRRRDFPASGASCVPRRKPLRRRGRGGGVTALYRSKCSKFVSVRMELGRFNLVSFPID